MNGGISVRLGEGSGRLNRHCKILHTLPLVRCILKIFGEADPPNFGCPLIILLYISRVEDCCSEALQFHDADVCG